MNEEVEKKLAESLTANSTDIIPFLPYLLQDFWSLASDQEDMIKLLKEHTGFDSARHVLDLACGKGAVAINLAKTFGCRAKGIDLIPEFIAEANAKAKEHGVADLCEFVIGDVNEAVCMERGYDLAVWGGSGDLLGDYAKTVEGLAQTVKPGGYILLDDAYVEDNTNNRHLRFHHNYPTREEWELIFAETGLNPVVCLTNGETSDPAEYAEDLGNIRRRAEELAAKYPDKRALFEDYVKNQQGEYEDLQDGVVGALWLLQKENKIK